jgi:hypothetical protein
VISSKFVLVGTVLPVYNNTISEYILIIQRNAAVEKLIDSLPACLSGQCQYPHTGSGIPSPAPRPSRWWSSAIRSASGYDLALVTTNTTASAGQIIERYTARRATEEVAIEDVKQLFGAGQARNRTAAAVERTFTYKCENHPV